MTRDQQDDFKDMKRILVIGCTGAGKSVFAEKLARITGLHLHHLDRLFRQPGPESSEPDRREWASIQAEIIQKPAWIIEGNYGATIEIRLRRADTAIFLDYSPLVCLYGLLSRVILSRSGIVRRPDIVTGCNEQLNLKLISSALTFKRKHRTGIMKGLGRYPHVRLIVLTSRREASRFLSELSAVIRS